MKREKIDLTEERKIIINMITDTKFLREIRPIINHNYFESSYANTVSRWIVEYYDNFKEAPNKNIQDIYFQKSKTIHSEEEAETLSKFLESLSYDHKITNMKYSVKRAIHWLKIQSLKLLNKKIKSAIDSDDPIHGESYVANFKRVEKPDGKGVLILKDSAKIADAFLAEDEKLFKFPKALGIVTGDFVRGDLVSYLAASGRGKTWWQLYTALTGMYFGFNCIFFTLEMPENQMVRRAWQSLVGRPKENCNVKIPYFKKINNGKYTVENIEEQKEVVSLSDLEKNQKSFRFHFRGGDLKIISVPAYSVDVDDIDAYLDNMIFYENYIADIIVIDYADLIRPSKNVRSEYRHQLDDIWKKLRRMAQERNALVVSASQAGRGSFNKDADEKDIAEDIRKLAHVSKMIAINQTKEEYKINVSRISQLKERDGRRYMSEVYVLQCLDIGKPHIDSKFKKEVKI